MKFETVHVGGPYGDACSEYKLVFLEPMTVGQFLDEVLTNKEEWGSVRIGSRMKDAILKFRHGQIEQLKGSLYKRYRDKVIESGHAHGGWSMMDYVLVVKESDNFLERWLENHGDLQYE